MIPLHEENKLGVMPITKLIWNMSLPIIASMLVQALYNIVDSWFVSRVSEQALTAVSLAFPAQNLMIGLATGTAVGVNALMGRALGAGLRERADKVANNGVFLAVVGFVISALLGLTCSDLFFRSQTQVESIIQMGNDYLRIVTIGSLGMFCQIMYERLLQGTGRSILSMYTQGLGAIINIILDPIFIFGLKMGVAGAAVATIIGQFCGCALAIYFNHKKNTDITLSLRGFRPNWRLIGEIYAIGLPSVIMIAIGSVMTFLMNKILITYHAAHETAATAFGVYFKLNSFIFMPIFGLNNGVIPIVAYNYGAQNRRRMMATIKRSALYACCIMVFGTVLFWVIPDTLLRLFDASDVMLAAGVPALRIISLSFCMAGACIALGSSFQALGKSMYSMITSIVRQLVFLIPIAYVLARYGASVGNSDLVWWCYPLAEIFSLALTLVFFSRMYKTIIAPLPEGHE
ncbi:MATE family efflux transporter [Vescimonas sp.]|uniref:MATE family efflux transporter n=1 Tax=Vescimonas sp. TaxID=2892404 RepID=UPI003F818E4F